MNINNQSHTIQYELNREMFDKEKSSIHFINEKCIFLFETKSFIKYLSWFVWFNIIANKKQRKLSIVIILNNYFCNFKIKNNKNNLILIYWEINLEIKCAHPNLDEWLHDEFFTLMLGV